MLGRKGFTLIELVMVIVILGILAVVAIPRFIDLRYDAAMASAQGIKGAGEAGAQIFHAKYLIENTTAGVYSVAYPNQSTACFEDNQMPTAPGGVTVDYDGQGNGTIGTWAYTVDIGGQSTTG